MKSILNAAGVAAVLFAGAAPAQAASYLSQSGFGISYCKTLSNTAAFATGMVLDASHVSQGCTGFFGVDIDTTAKTITLTSLQYGNYNHSYLSITGITELAITGLSTISYIPLFDPAFYGNPSLYGGLPAPTLSYSGSSIGIDFSTEGQSPSQFTFAPIEAGGKAVFAYTTSVPETDSWAMMIAGFGLVGGVMRRRAIVAA